MDGHTYGGEEKAIDEMLRKRKKRRGRAIEKRRIERWLSIWDLSKPDRDK